MLRKRIAEALEAVRAVKVPAPTMTSVAPLRIRDCYICWKWFSFDKLTQVDTGGGKAQYICSGCKTKLADQGTRPG